MAQRTVSQLNFDRIVFEGRNTAYGAFYLRQEYNTNLKNSLLFVFILMLGATAFYGFRPCKCPEQSLLPPIIVDDTTEIILDNFEIEKKELKNTIAVVNPENKFSNSSEIPKIVKDDAIVETKVKDFDPNAGTQIVGTGVGIGDTTTGDNPSGNPTLTIVSAPTGETSILKYAPTMPEFPGGDKALYKYLSENIKFPTSSLGKNGRVAVSFVINTDGSITDVKVEKGFSEDCDEEAVRVVSNMPKWKPGKSNERLVRIRKILPIKFQSVE